LLYRLRRAMVETVLPSSRSRLGENGFKGPQVTSIRQKNLLEEAVRLLKRVDPQSSAEFIAADLAETTEYLAEITGRITDEEVLERIFSRFCVGK
jgi:tRNA U34 5-carboxymethylaminomethyl modifying GTPase MnmE/TrmE